MKFITSLAAGAILLAASAALADDNTVRPAVGKPLQQAEAELQQHDCIRALALVNKARAAGHLTPYESLVIAQVEGSAAAGAGHYVEAANAYQAVLNAGGAAGAARIQYIQAIASFYDAAHDYPHTILWVNKYLAAGGGDPRTRILLAQSYYQAADYPHAEQAAKRDEALAAAEGRTLPEPELQLLASAAQKSGDQPGYQAALRSLLQAYPNPRYWAASIAGVATGDFPDRLTLDLDRLRFRTGNLTLASDYEDYAERAILAGNPAEAHQVIESGYAAGILNDKIDGGHASRLRALAAKQAAGGDSAAAEAEAAQNAQKSGAPDAALDSAIAAYDSGNRAAAVANFERVASSTGPDGALAQLWLVFCETKPVAGGA